ncbi:Eco57I restriction-modification methylase domain-containing protein [Candidatus Sumerlaeota bacterium]|nr:Eco57I restriction-modification methylase domain-containing protein [Candidatus Sumerlaeota bacterium]
MLETLDTIEIQRIALQAGLDARKTQSERNRLGQFATPSALALDILRYSAALFSGEERMRFLDPAVGTGAFFSALRSVFPAERIEEALGFEIDPHYGEPSSQLWEQSGLSLRIADFTQEKASPRFNLIVCNPPYVRHHHLQNGEKKRLQMLAYVASDTKIGGLAGLYCYFLCLAHAWMEKGGVAGWLIPSEFMDVNYGQAIKRYLLERVTLFHIHRFDPNDVQFSDALVSSVVVWFRNTPPPEDHEVMFSLGGSLLAPNLSRSIPAKVLADESKWTRFPLADIRSRTSSPTLSDFFDIKRGLATGDNDYFILSEKDLVRRGLPMEICKPILPSPRHLSEDEVRADKDGNPALKHRLFLLDTRLGEGEIQSRFPSLWRYLEEGKARGLHERYLCRHRSPWYAQENRPPAPIVCTYLGRLNTKRGRPFRFIFNASRATVANVYLAMYPRPILGLALARDPNLIRHVWQILNEIAPDQLLGEGRVYGGGLHKLEPRELANVDASAIAEVVPGFRKMKPTDQPDMFGALRR